ncbi:MAG: DUF1289 domain-containing protein [Zoogloea sp.]|uniref:DUF1289 domain-containing protein n=1 Tax=Zoogloea sp. TaxID=49181 RepID=UPI003F2E0E58
MSEENDSPCVGVCQMDESGYCLGCGRSADEIFGSDFGSDDAAVSPAAPVSGAQATDGRLGAG